MDSSRQVWVLLLSGNTQKKMAENTKIRNSVHESFNNNWTGCIFVPFLLQMSRTEIMIFFGSYYHFPKRLVA